MILTIKRILFLLIRFIKRLRNYGLFKTISYEFSEYRFDHLRNIHTRKINFMHELDLSSDSLCYAATTEKCFKSIVQNIEDKFFNMNFVDFGCGKGKVLILARENGFSGSVAGVELSKKLCSLAEKNIQSCNVSADVFNIDAASYKVKDKDSIFFFYNPFNKNILDKVLDNILESVKSYPRDILVIYVNPVFSKDFTNKFKLILDFDADLGQKVNIYGL